MGDFKIRSIVVAVFSSFFLLIAGCASKDDVAPVDVEKQAFEDLRDDIRNAVTDPARAAEVIRLVGMLEQDLATLRKTIKARKDRARELNADYDTSRADFEAFIAGVEAEVHDHEQRVSETHQSLRATLTAEERVAIKKTHTKAMYSAIATIQSI